MSLSVGLLAEGKRLFAIALVRNDRCRPTFVQPLSQGIAVVSAIAEEFLGWFGAAYQPLGRRTIMCLARTQEDGKKTASSICHCMDFRIAPAA